jgi:transcriptional regulator with XRE-family HTH domain
MSWEDRVDEPADAFRARLRKAMPQLLLQSTKRELAERFGVKASTLYRWEKGVHAPRGQERYVAEKLLAEVLDEAPPAKSPPQAMPLPFELAHSEGEAVVRVRLPGGSALRVSVKVEGPGDLEDGES